MAEYKRWMAYLYNYENGFKKNCVGTARIERRGNEAKTTVSIQVPSLMNESLKNFYYIRTPEGVRGISAGEYTTNGSSGNWQISMNADDMGGSELEAGQFKLKNLATREETVISLAELDNAETTAFNA